MIFYFTLAMNSQNPSSPRVADLEYIPTQYLSEFIKKCGYDGVIFKSSISEGVNVTLFDDTKVCKEKVTQYKVTSLKYKSLPIG